MIRFGRKHFLPTDNFGEMIYFGLIIIAVGTYVCRYVLALLGSYGPFGFLAIFFLPLICLPIMGELMFLGSSVFYLWKSKDPFPLLAFFPLVALAAYFLPLAPIPQTAEEKYFTEHRAEIDHIVNLAQQGRLNSYSPQWEATIVKQDPLVMIFSPKDFYGFIAYADGRKDLKATEECYWDGGIYRQLDEHWWLCRRGWN